MPRPPRRPTRRGARIAVFLSNLGGGGAEASMLRVAGGMAQRGHAVDLVLCRREGALLSAVPTGVRVVELRPAPPLAARLAALRADPGGLTALAPTILFTPRPLNRIEFLPGLVRYIGRERPAAMLAALVGPNTMAVLARRLAGTPTRVVVSQRNALAAYIEGHRTARKLHLPALIRRVWAQADAITAVSDGVADDLAAATGLPRERIITIHNPIVGPATAARAAAPVDHPWLAPGEPPVVLGAGWLIAQKDFATLLRAFALVRAARPARLVILGAAKQTGEDVAEHARLMALAGELGVADDVELPGFVENPLAWMAKAGVFVLSSRFEGLPGVLIEALAAGCPVVATDCPHGPREILENGRIGPLVPVGDATAMARAIRTLLAHPPPRALLTGRAADFSIDAAVTRYLDLLTGSTVAAMGY